MHSIMANNNNNTANSSQKMTSEVSAGTTTDNDVATRYDDSFDKEKQDSNLPHEKEEKYEDAIQQLKGENERSLAAAHNLCHEASSLSHNALSAIQHKETFIENLRIRDEQIALKRQEVLQNLISPLRAQKLNKREEEDVTSLQKKLQKSQKEIDKLTTQIFDVQSTNITLRKSLQSLKMLQEEEGKTKKYNIELQDELVKIRTINLQMQYKLNMANSQISSLKQQQQFQQCQEKETPLNMSMESYNQPIITKMEETIKEVERQYQSQTNKLDSISSILKNIKVSSSRPDYPMPITNERHQNNVDNSLFVSSSSSSSCSSSLSTLSTIPNNSNAETTKKQQHEQENETDIVRSVKDITSELSFLRQFYQNYCKSTNNQNGDCAIQQESTDDKSTSCRLFDSSQDEVSKPHELSNNDASKSNHTNTKSYAEKSVQTLNHTASTQQDNHNNDDNKKEMKQKDGIIQALRMNLTECTMARVKAERKVREHELEVQRLKDQLDSLGRGQKHDEKK